MSLAEKLIPLAAGLLGACGVAAAAASSHAGAALLGPLSLVALTHAPALLALGRYGDTRPQHAATLVLAAGALLFCADLATRHFAGSGLFPLAAPLGGMLMIAGWALVAMLGFFAPRR